MTRTQGTDCAPSHRLLPPSANFDTSNLHVYQVFCVLLGSALVVLTPSSMVLRATMDMFQHRYYRLNKIVMTLIGQWPYQSTRSAYGFLALVLLVAMSEMVPQVTALVKYGDNWSIILDSIPALLFEAVCFTKLIGFMWNSRKTMMLLNRIRTDWQLWARDREVNILHEYAEQGKKMAFAYAVVIYSTAFAFVVQPTIPKIIDSLLKNGTELGTYPFPVEYYLFDDQKYYFYLMMYCTVCVCVAASVLIAGDVILIIYMQHVCGIFAALGHKLQRIGHNDRSAEKEETPYALEKRDMVQLALCIDRHNDAIEYANLIEAAHRWIFFFVIGFGIILGNILGLQVFLGINSLKDSIRFALFILAVTFHLYVTCYISQNLMDHSISVGFCINNSRWYRLSPRSQKVLQLMTMRCNVPCQLTTGKMLIMSMTTFLLVCRTTISYFMVVRSMQKL